MREIKFRAYDKKEKKMHYGNMEMFDDMIGFRFGHFGVDTSKEDIKLMQSTRLKDKNGCEIYEGDICKSKVGYVGKIVWSASSAEFSLSVKRELNKYISENHALLYSYREFEVIGNIYENPELLEGVE